ncbi:MAG: ComF family protein [Holosporaceae bacterium]|jgi:ComF family protein|nr:ComF family protein [Holosporaceae bacterium]
MARFINKTLEIIKNICFPIACCNCGDFVDSEGLCFNCWKRIEWISDPKCKICGVPFEIDLDAICPVCLRKKPNFDKAVAAFKYDDFSRNMILKFKHWDATHIAEKFGRWMYGACAADIANADVIVPVPIHFLKRLKRQYNQSELLGLELQKFSGIHYEPRILKKIKRTAPQEGLTREKRLKNVRGSFEIDENYVSLIEGKFIILVDDVLTTGSTVNECSKMLKKYNAARVVVVTIARVDS